MGELFVAVEETEGERVGFVTPPGYDEQGRPWDWVLVVKPSL
jgi:hypothetical protein